MRVICEEIDGWPQELSRKKKFPKNSRKKVVLEWEKEIAIMHMYPIQTVGSSCPTFPASAAKKTMFSSLFHHFSSWQAALSALKARPSRNICTRGVTFISHHHSTAPCTEIKVSSKDIWRRWKFAYLSNVYSNFPLNNFYSRSNSLSSTPLSLLFW